MIKYADVIVDLQAGDTGKGKVAHHLAATPNEYTHVIRYNGGGNAGHTFFHNEKKFITHFIPVGVFYGIKSIIGPGCVVNPIALIEEMKCFEKEGINVKDFLFVDKRVHIIIPKHLKEEEGESNIGTTKTGNGPAYRDKYWRKGIRFSDYMKANVIDIYEELHNENECKILFEGAQGFELDIDWGDYPYVTSSHCTVGGAIMNGVPPQKIRKVIGIAKAYNTYVGAKQFESNDLIFSKIREVGNEYGSTTGRARQVNWIDLDKILMASNINGCSEIIFNKLDVLESVGVYKLYHRGILMEIDTIDEFCSYIQSVLKVVCRFSKTALSI